jgi:hypothetical protein
MKVRCELDIANDQTHPTTKVVFEGDPMVKSEFVHLVIGDSTYEIRPSDVEAALQRVRSDA